jgi:hypothetical protein
MGLNLLISVQAQIVIQPSLMRPKNWLNLSEAEFASLFCIWLKT